MKSLLKYLPKVFAQIVCVLFKLSDALAGLASRFHRRSFSQEAVDLLLKRIEVVRGSDGQELAKFLAPTNLTLFRADTLFSKEPDTISWIDSFEKGSVFWDVGANIGTYSVYALAKHADLRVVAVEPSPLNLELLVRNVAANAFQGNRFSLVPLALTEKSGESGFTLSSTELGGALNAFGVDYGHDGNPISSAISYSTVGVALDDLVKFFGISTPRYLKIDVDGIEHLVLRGGAELLRRPELKSVLIELNKDFREQYDTCFELLLSAGLKEQGRVPANALVPTETQSTFNIVFARSGE